MHESLQDLYRKQAEPTKDTQLFLENLEINIGNDLWKSAGGIWSDSSVQKFRETAVLKLFHGQTTLRLDPQEAWIQIIRDFHSDQPKPFWGETRLTKKEKKPQSEEQKIFWELFTYIWAAA